MRNLLGLVLLSLAASSLASPIDTHNLDVAVNQVDTPKNMHAECDMRDPQCKAINDSGFHSVNEFEGHLGRPAGVMTNTGSKVAADEDQVDLSDTLRDNGPVVQHDLQGRDHSELNKDLKAIGHESYPDGSVRYTGEELDKQGQAAEHVGEGVHDFGREAHRQFGAMSTGCKYHCDEAADAIVN